MVLASTLHNHAALMRRGHGGGSVFCFAFATLLQAVQRRYPQGTDGFFARLVFSFLVDGVVPASFSFCIRKVARLTGLTAGGISRSHSKKCPLRTSFGTKHVGKAVPALDTLTPFPFPDGDEVETCRENTPSFKCFSYNL